MLVRLRSSREHLDFLFHRRLHDLSALIDARLPAMTIYDIGRGIRTDPAVLSALRHQVTRVKELVEAPSTGKSGSLCWCCQTVITSA